MHHSSVHRIPIELKRPFKPTIPRNSARFHSLTTPPTKFLTRNKSGASIYKIPSDPKDPVKTKDIVIVLESIYGESDYIWLSNVEIMLSNQIVLPIKNIELINHDNTATNINNLNDRNLVKDETDCFCHPWDGTSIAIKFCVETNEQPTILRIFNPSNGFNGHVKHFSVFSGMDCLLTEMIPSDYGNQFSIVKNIEIPKLNIDIFSPENKEPIFPVIKSNTVEIELIENFNKHNDTFSFNCFEIVSFEGRRLKPEQIKDIQIFNAVASCFPMDLMERKDKYKFIVIETTDLSKRPKIVFRFIKPVRVAFVRIIGYVPITVKETAISKVKITCGGFITKYSRCVFSPILEHDDFVQTTDVYFVDLVGLNWRENKLMKQLSAFSSYDE